MADKNIQFDLGHIEPAAVFGGVDEFYTVANAFGLLGREGFIEGARLVGAEVVKDQRDFVSLLVAVRKLPNELCPIGFRLSFRHLCHPFSGQRLVRHEYVADPAPLILIVITLRVPLSAGDGRACFFDELSRRFIHADDRMAGIIGAFVDIK